MLILAHSLFHLIIIIIIIFIFFLFFFFEPKILYSSVAILMRPHNLCFGVVMKLFHNLF